MPEIEVIEIIIKLAETRPLLVINLPVVRQKDRSCATRIHGIPTLTRSSLYLPLCDVTQELLSPLDWKYLILV